VPSASASPDPAALDRRALRERLHQVRDRFAAQSGAAAHAALAEHLKGVLVELEPQRLGLYWPLRSEFNAALACVASAGLESVDLALPFTKKSPREMEYRPWDGAVPAVRDECGIPSVPGVAVVPDVVLVPCLGYTASGYRVGYGGGYFDRWLARHPHATTVGLAWSATQIDEATFGPQPHDLPLMLILTERGVVDA